MNFWTNPENSALRMMLIVLIVAGTGLFVFKYAHINPFRGTGQVIDYGYAVPAVTTSPATFITPTSGVLNGVVNALNATFVTSGFNYGTTTSYGNTINLSYPISVAGSGFSSPVVSTILPPGCTYSTTYGYVGAGGGPCMPVPLVCNTTYHFQAFATNSIGTSYGLDLPFTTSPCTGPVTPPIVLYQTNIAGCSSTMGYSPTTGMACAGGVYATSITPTSATVYGYVADMGGAPSVATGFNFGLSTSYGGTATSTTIVSTSGTAGSFSSNIPGLLCGHLYYYRPYATNSAGTVTGSTSASTLPTFTTLPCPVTPPTVVTVASGVATSVSATGAVLTSSLTNTGGAPSTTVGINWGTATPTYGSTFTVAAPMTAAGNFVSTLTGLACNTTKHYRAYATNSAGTVYGADSAFSTLPCLPTVTTNAATSLAMTSAVLNGTLNSLGGAPSADVGFRYGLSTTTYGPTTIATSLTAPGVFNKTITGLACETVYHYQALSQDSAGIAYGADLTFKTLPCPLGVVTVSATDNLFTGTTIYGGTTLTGKLTGTGGAPSTNVGFDVGATTAYGIPVPWSSVTSIGNFVISIGLTCQSTYHFRAKASNSFGTVYGADMLFTTGNCGTPTVATNAATSVTTGGSVLNGTISSTGGSNVTTRGFNYGLSTTYGSTTTASGSWGASTFSATISSLACNNTYHYRAYATNVRGISYGTDLTFKTGACTVFSGGATAATRH